MKKALSLILVLVMICSFAACGNKNNSTPDKNPAIVEFLEKNGDDFIAAMESSFATSSGMTCESDVEVIGNGFVVSIKINELQDVPEETKELMQDTYDSMSSMFDGALEEMQKELPELEYWTIKVCEKDGDVLATIRID